MVYAQLLPMRTDTPLPREKIRGSKADMVRERQRSGPCAMMRGSVRRALRRRPADMTAIQSVCLVVAWRPHENGISSVCRRLHVAFGVKVVDPWFGWCADGTGRWIARVANLPIPGRRRPIVLFA
jgi:hypothetical protein